MFGCCSTSPQPPRHPGGGRGGLSPPDTQEEAEEVSVRGGPPSGAGGRRVAGCLLPGSPIVDAEQTERLHLPSARSISYSISTNLHLHLEPSCTLTLALGESSFLLPPCFSSGVIHFKTTIYRIYTHTINKKETHNGGTHRLFLSVGSTRLCRKGTNYRNIWKHFVILFLRDEDAATFSSLTEDMMKLLQHQPHKVESLQIIDIAQDAEETQQT